MDTPRLLVIDDDPEVAEFITEVARLASYTATTGHQRNDIETYLTQHAPAVIILDLQMPGMDGVEFLRWLAGRQISSRILLISGEGTRVLNAALRLGEELKLNMLGTMQKPLRLSVLEKFLQNVHQTLPSAESLRSALEQRQMVLHYQPQIALDASGETIVGMEALVRWQRPDVGLVPPAEFIPLVEQSGLIVPMTEYVLMQAVQEIIAWREQGLALAVAVNISPMLLERLDLPDFFSEMVSRAGVEPNKLKLEVTESGTMQNVTRSMDILTRFRLKGFDLCMDDFGTGYSSLVQLHRMPFSELKIDKSFLLECERNDEARVIIHTCVDLARNLGLSVCAEGVETKAALQLLQDFGCTHAQGYYIGRPMPAAEVLKWAAARRQAAK